MKACSTRSAIRMAPTLRRVSVAVAVCATAILAGCSDSSTVAPIASKLAPASRSSSIAPAGSLGVLILGSTVSGGSSSLEAQAATAAGQPFTIVTDAVWQAMTAADFSQYRALILGDPRCSGHLAPAALNKTVWGPVTNGNVFIIGSDPSFHASSRPGAAEVIKSGIKFAADAEGATGAYITLSCDAANAVALGGLSTLGTFTSVGNPPCGTTVAKVADHPALSLLTAASLSGWGCSIHETFTAWPSDFEVLAIALDGGNSYTAPDGTKGTPYILARGKGLVVVSDIKLTPTEAAKDINTTATITATVLANAAPVANTDVTFTVADGPNAGKTATVKTDASGVASFTYTSTVVGVDGVRATFVDALTRTQTSNRAAITWALPLDASPPVITPTVTGTLNASGWYTSDVNVSWTVTDAESAISAQTGCAATPLTANQNEVTYTCAATSAGGSASQSVKVKIDKTIPTVTGAVSSGTLVNGWYVDNVAVSWTPSVAGPSAQTLSADCSDASFTTDGSHTFTCSVTTGAGLSSAPASVTVKRDAQSPRITYTLTGTQGNNFWFTTNVGVLWTTTAGPSGVGSCSSAPVSTDGTNITFSCTATAGNGKIASLTTVAAKRDATKPVIAYTNNAGTYTVDQNVSIICKATDAMSDIATKSCANITGPAYTFNTGVNSFTGSAVDNAGNTNSASTSFTVTTTSGSLCTLVNLWVSNGGVANSLCGKIEKGNYEPFRNELAAQSGKKITESNAAILLRLVNEIDHP
jgi:hypothetical protein